MKYVISVGNPYDGGIDLIGPFDSPDEAIKFAENNLPVEWHVVPVEDKDKYPSLCGKAAERA